MAKREIPLFIFDLGRDHNLGECDFVVCTDVDNAFTAKIDYVTDVENVITDTVRIVQANGNIKLRLKIKRITGKNPDKAAIRNLLKKAEELYCERTKKKINLDRITKKDMIDFLDVFVFGNKHHLSEAGANYEERKTLLTSLTMLEAIKSELKKETLEK